MSSKWVNVTIVFHNIVLLRYYLLRFIFHISAFRKGSINSKVIVLETRFMTQDFPCLAPSYLWSFFLLIIYSLTLSFSLHAHSSRTPQFYLVTPLKMSAAIFEIEKIGDTMYPNISKPWKRNKSAGWEVGRHVMFSIVNYCK